MRGQLVPLLLAAHFVGDWIVQTDWQAANKMTSWRANMAHMLGYHWCILLATCVAFWPEARGWAWQPAVIVVVSLVTHAFIDRRWPVKWLCDHTGSAAFGQTAFGIIAVDQALHLSILCILAAVFA